MHLTKYFSTQRLRLFALLLALLLGLPSLTATAQSSGRSKSIHLRNERITTRDRSVQPRSEQPAPANARRLTLIQFEGPIQPEWRESLQRLGVDLLRYIPEDTYIAHLGNTPPGQLKRLEFIRWVGPYKPEHRIHKKVREYAVGAQSRGEPVGVSILVAPRAKPAEVAALKTLLAGQATESRLCRGTVLRGWLSAERLDQLAESDAVLWVEPAPAMTLYDEEAAKIVGGDDGFRSTPTVTQQLGYDGSGVVVAVADTGLDSGNAAQMHPDLAGRVDSIQFYGSLTDGSDEHSHGTHVAGIIAGNATVGESDANAALYGLGVASGAHIVSQRIFDGAGQFQAPPTFETLTRDAVTAGADIGNNSWGEDNQGSYDLSAMEFDGLVRDSDSLTPGDQPYILEFSAGNSGPGSRTIGTPAVAKNVIATGASQNNRSEFQLYPDGQEAMADFSSRGPCEDGRIKPDVTAPGTWIASLRSVFADDGNAWSGISQSYMFQGGTSQAGPQVAGAAAVFVQYYRAMLGGATPSPALVKAALINSCVDLDDDFGTTPIPNNSEGWGRVDLTRIIDSSRTTVWIDQTNLLTTGASYETTLVVSDGSEPLKITLTYTDVPGFPGAVPALVNDLDLEVVAPDGRLYLGNALSNGDSIPNPASPDSINNVEGVHILTPEPGEYCVRVYARNVPSDARIDTGAVDQDFALAMSGRLPAPGTSLIYMNRTAYTAPDQIGLGVIDREQAGQPSAIVNVVSDTEPAGESLTLIASGGGGLFTNILNTTTGTAASDSLLQVAHGDTITASYFDATAGVLRTAVSQADLLAPAITNVDTVDRFGRATILWETDEPATSRMEYGTNSSLGSLLTSTPYTTEHALTPEGLLPGKTYYYRVISDDIAGNSATNDNGGSLFTFVAPNPPPVLLVDAFYDDLLFIPPPLSRYTDPLDAIGVEYDVWDHEVEGSPSLTDLRAYRVVIWRVPEANFTRTLTPGEQTVITDYLEQGGGFFVASMELTTRLDGTDFLSDVLHVDSFTPDTGAPDVTGVTGDPIGDGVALTLDFLTDYFGFDTSDTITPSAEAAGIFTEDVGNDLVGLRYPGPGVQSPGRVVFLSFPFETLPASGTAPNNRTEVLRRMLQFLSPGITGEAVVSTDRAAYSLPSVITVEVGDVDLEGSGTLNLTALSTTDPTGKTFVLQETSNLGLFRGQIPLVHATNSPATNELRAVAGDTLTFRFFDSSIPGNVEASALVDIIAPAITNTTSEPGYSTATIQWETDEACDSLVQFGESLPLPINRTQFSPALRASHNITLTGLEPNRNYFYQVVSRDAAGNATVDDNAGSFHTFTTLTPLSAPFVDDFETGATNWSVFSEYYTESEWTLGVPNNGVETAAHSTNNAWGSMLNAGSWSLIDTYLYSPAIHLTSGNQITLRFWHSRDFEVPGAEDILGGGEVTLIEVGTQQETQLALYQDDNSGWEQESIDLTSYLGKVVQFVWHYQLFSFDYEQRGGWLVDDVEIVVDTINPGTVTVSNSLAQAVFTLSGPTPATGFGPVMTLTNAAAGEYSVAFGALPFHVTPAPQTNTLAEGGAITFSALYAFPDANGNGISDLWEQAYLGGASTNHPAATDTDNDGASDADEFASGTNPTNALSQLSLSLTPQPNNLVRAQWPTTPGRLYLLERSSNLIDWEAASAWTRAGGASLSELFSSPTNATMYRVQVQP